MTKNPFYNALVAIGYIFVVVSGIHYMSKFDEPQSVIVPMTAISLFTLSAAVMAFIFFYQPFKMYFADQKQEAVKLFLKTVGIFAVITACLIILVISLSS